MSSTDSDTDFVCGVDTKKESSAEVIMLKIVILVFDKKGLHLQVHECS